MLIEHFNGKEIYAGWARVFEILSTHCLILLYSTRREASTYFLETFDYYNIDLTR